MKQKTDFEKFYDNTYYLSKNIFELISEKFNILSDRELEEMLAEFIGEDFDRSSCNTVEEMSKKWLTIWKRRRK